MTSKKVEVTTLTFRDGPQSTGMWDDYFRLFGAALNEWKRGENGESLRRLRRIADLVKKAGFSGAEVFWGQSFQKFMLAKIDPFEAMALNREVFGPDFMLSGLGRGVNAVGFRPYGQDVIETFVERFAERGGVPGKKLIRMRVFDALNNVKNCSTMITAAVRHNRRVAANKGGSLGSGPEPANDSRETGLGKLIHIEAALCYQPERAYRNQKLYSDEYYVEYAKKLIDVAAQAGGELDSLVIKDMAGQLDPIRTKSLLPKLTSLGLPVYLHAHCTNYSLAVETMRVAAANGIAGIETVEWPLSGGTSHASVRDVIAGNESTFINIDLVALSELEQELQALFGKKAELLSQEGDPQAKRLDLRVKEESRLELWKLGIPGGAMAAVMNLLQNEVCKYKKVSLSEATAVFAVELEHLQNRIGWVPLVTPMADIVYTQAILNVINGRDRIVEHRYAKMVVGLYGAHIDHATGERVAIEVAAKEAVLAYCKGVQEGDVKTPSFGMSYPPPSIVVEAPAPALEMPNARNAISDLLARAQVETSSPAADEAAIMRLMEPPASEGTTEKVLLRSVQGKIAQLINVFKKERDQQGAGSVDDMRRLFRAYGAKKRAQTFAQFLVQSKMRADEIRLAVMSEAKALLGILTAKVELEQAQRAIELLTTAVLENSYLENLALLKTNGKQLPFGPESGIYFLYSELDPYSSEARSLLREHWDKEYQAHHLHRAITNNLPLEGDAISKHVA